MLNLLLVGYGKMGNIHARSVIKSKNAKLCGIVDPNFNDELKNINDVRVYNNIEKVKLDEGIDGVIISSTTNSHYSVLKKIISYNIPILVEKPLSINLKEVMTITKECLERKIVLQAGFIEIYNPVVDYLKKNKLANIEEIKIFRHSEPPEENRNLENVLYDLAIHDISVFDFLYTLDNASIIDSNTETYSNKISNAEVNFTANNIKVNLNVSNRSRNKIRNWKIKTDTNLYEIDFLNKNILIKSKNNTTQLINLNKDALPVDTQLNSFIQRINDNFIDIEHTNSINKCHEFISLIN